MAHWQARSPIEIRTVAERLHVISATSATPKGHRSQRHAYFLVRDGGNLLFHGPDRVPFYREHRDFFDEHGGIARQVLTHAGDASRACAFVEKTWRAPIHVNQWELAEARQRSGSAIERGFPNDEPIGPDVEALHLPSHAVGFHCYRFELAGRRYLLCGHMMRQTPAGWGAIVAPQLLEAGIRSFKSLRSLDVDILLPDRSQREPAPPLAFGPEERAACIQSTFQYLEKKHRVEIA